MIDRWWWRPSQIRVLIWLPVLIVAGSLGGDHPAGQRFTAGRAVALAVAIVAIVPLVVSGVRLIVDDLVIGPARAWLIRRATGRSVYFSRGRLQERRRHARLEQKGSKHLD